jgi:hypothetical protein
MFRASSVPIIRSYQLYKWQLVFFMQVMWPLPRPRKLPTWRKNLPPLSSGQTVAAASYCETPVPVYQTMRSHISKARKFEAFFRENFISHTVWLCSRVLVRSFLRPASVLDNHLQCTSLQSVLNRKPTVVTRLRAQRSGLRIPLGAKDFSLLQSVQNDCGANSASYLVGTAVFSRG